MANQRNNSLDGFVPRRPGAQSASQLSEQSANRFTSPRPMGSTEHPSVRTVGVATIAKSDMDESLKGIDQPVAGKGRRKRGDKKPKSLLRRVLTWSVILQLVYTLSIGVICSFRPDIS